jgi:hypothetical protein
MGDRASLNAVVDLCLAAVVLSGCADRHQIQKLFSPDGGYVLLVDYVQKPFGTEDVLVSLEEKRGLASVAAVFRNIQSFQAAWLGPEDIGICQVGRVQTYKTVLTINSHLGNQDFHFHYVCPLS